MVYSSSAATAAYQKRGLLKKKAPELLYQTTLFHDPAFLNKQIVWVALALGALFLFYHIDYAKLGRYSPLILIVSVILLIMVLILGNKVNGAKRWLRIGSFTLQPSEFAKLALVIFMARFLSEHKDKVKSFAKGFLPVLAILSITLILVVREPDFGATVVIGAIVFIIWFIAGLRILHLSSLFIASVPCAVVAIIAEPYRLKRILAFLNPWSDPMGGGYQIIQAQVAVGSGGLLGRGLGAGLQKYQFLSEAHTDYIFAIVGEEVGLVGSIFVVLMFVLLLMLGVTVALRATDYYTGLLASGIVTMICLSAAVNFWVVLGMLPPKGLALPFISYGGSSLLVNMAAIGILLNISKTTEEAMGVNPRLKYAFGVR
jgi:cell division protein FtsW